VTGLEVEGGVVVEVVVVVVVIVLVGLEGGSEMEVLDVPDEGVVGTARPLSVKGDVFSPSLVGVCLRILILALFWGVFLPLPDSFPPK
jgi:hypothetical protein